MDKRALKQKCIDFIESLNGRFRDDISDRVLASILFNELLNNIGDKFEDNERLGNAAYKSAIPIFEVMFEYQFNYACNGHHLSQQFADLFLNI